MSEITTPTPSPTPEQEQPVALPQVPPPGAPSSSVQQSSVPQQMSPAECAHQLKQLFPALFSGQVKPLKLRIQIDIQERAPGRFSKQVLSAFFRRHTGSTSYLMAVAKAPHRFDLDGKPSGDITDEHRKVALDELARRRAGQESRRELEEQQRRNRAGLLHDFQTTTLTAANFCALKGVAVEELDGLLSIARAEAQERARHAPPPRQAPGFDRQRRPGPPNNGPRSRPPR
jgi:ProP effector